MSIEKDLNQTKPFKNAHQRALVNLLYTSRHAEAPLQKFHKEQGLTLKQFNILRILKGAGQPISTQVIRERMIDRMSDISRIVDRLVTKGVVTKIVNPADKRLVDITINEAGCKLITAVTENLEAIGPALPNLTVEDAQQLNRLLDKIRGH